MENAQYFVVICEIMTVYVTTLLHVFQHSFNPVVRHWSCSLHFPREVSLGWSGSRSMIQDHSDHGASKEPTNPFPEWIHQFLWCTMVRAILDHWSWFKSSQRNTPTISLPVYFAGIFRSLFKRWMLKLTLALLRRLWGSFPQMSLIGVKR